MKNFKRILTSFMLIFSIILLIACGGEKSKTYYMSENGSEMTVKVKYKDDVVNELDIDAKMSYKSLDVENQEQAKLLFSMIKSMGASGPAAPVLDQVLGGGPGHAGQGGLAGGQERAVDQDEDRGDDEGEDRRAVHAPLWARKVSSRVRWRANISSFSCGSAWS